DAQAVERRYEADRDRRRRELAHQQRDHRLARDQAEPQHDERDIQQVHGEVPAEVALDLALEGGVGHGDPFVRQSPVSGGALPRVRRLLYRMWLPMQRQPDPCRTATAQRRNLTCFTSSVNISIRYI